jgi:hypothetical protein
MPRFPLALSLAVVLSAVIAPVGIAAVDPAEWDAAVDAALAVDPTLDLPSNDPAIATAVGGGHPVGAFVEAFGFGATSGPAGVNGRMTLDLGFGNTLHADVVCLAVARLGDDRRVATIVGALEPNDVVQQPLMVFHVTDSGPGEPDMWHSQFSTLDPCIAFGSTTPIDGGIAINVP